MTDRSLTSKLRVRKFRWSLLLGLVFLAFASDIAAGSVPIPLKAVLDVLLGKNPGETSWVYIIHQIRLPKAFTAVLSGCGLAVSGLQMQTIFRNPLAGPSTLGITSGAGLGVALVMLSSGTVTSMYTIMELGVSGNWLIVLSSSLGAAAVMLLVMAISAAIKNKVIVLIVALMIGNITLSVVSIWQYFSSPEMIRDYLIWTFGSLGGVTGIQLLILSVVVFTGLALSFLSSKMLDALLLGNDYAKSMGLNVRTAMLIVVFSTSILAGGITAFCGPIGFVGVAVPHLARTLFCTSNHRILIPGCCLIGTLLMLVCDLVSQLPGGQVVLPINVITALIGSPVVIWVIVRARKTGI